MNSLTLLFTCVMFVLFGYISFVRTLHKQYKVPDDTTSATAYQIVTNLLTSIGQSFFIITLPTLSVFLFWGVAPAFLCLLICHLLSETICNFQLANNSFSIKRAPRELHLVLGIYLILLSSFAISFAITIISQHSGLIFFLSSLFIAHTLWLNANSTIKKILLPAICLMLGLVFSFNLGLVVHGNWSPFIQIFNQDLSWLQVNNTTIMATTVTFMGWYFANNRHTITKDLSLLAGASLLLLTLTLLVKLAYIHPAVVTPIHPSGGENTPPSFLILCIILFAGFAGTVLKIFANNDSKKDSSSTMGSFALLQGSSLFNLTINLLILLILASGFMSITDWEGRFATFDDNLNIIEHFKFAILGIQKLLFKAPQTLSLFNTLFVSTLCIAAFSLALWSMKLICEISLTLNEGTETNNQTLTPQSRTSLYLYTCITIVLLFTYYFIDRGISFQMWLVFGMLNWLVISFVLCLASQTEYHEDKKNLIRLKISAAFNLIIISLGLIQSSLLMINWFLQKHYFYSVCALIIVISAVYFLHPTYKQFILLLRQKQPSNLDLS